jgi:hypothetical protein
MIKYLNNCYVYFSLKCCGSFDLNVLSIQKARLKPYHINVVVSHQNVNAMEETALNVMQELIYMGAKILDRLHRFGDDHHHHETALPGSQVPSHHTLHHRVHSKLYQLPHRHHIRHLIGCSPTEG